MSLLKRNKEKQLAAERKLATQHAIVKMGVDRNVRDAYFNGLVFAAVANDDQIDESERARLLELGEALELATGDVAGAIQCLTVMDDDAKMNVIEESARQLTNVEVAECFLKDFEEIWTLGGGNKGELDEFKPQLIGWMGDEVSVAKMKKREAAKKEETVEDIRFTELKKWLVELVKKEEWVIEYDLKAIRAKFVWAGIKEHFQTTLLKLLMPHARKAFAAFKHDLPNMEYSTNYSDRIISVYEYLSGCELLNCCSLMNVVTTKADLYRVVDRPVDSDERYRYSSSEDLNLEQVTNGSAMPTRIVWSWRSKDGERNAKRACCEIFDRILSEFEFRATW